MVHNFAPYADVTTKTEVEVLEEEEWHAAKQAITEALDKLIEFRTQEGAALQRSLRRN